MLTSCWRSVQRSTACSRALLGSHAHFEKMESWHGSPRTGKKLERKLRSLTRNCCGSLRTLTRDIWPEEDRRTRTLPQQTRPVVQSRTLPTPLSMHCIDREGNSGVYRGEEPHTAQFGKATNGSGYSKHAVPVTGMRLLSKTSRGV